MTDIKYAILDTDFVSKSHIIRNEEGSTLADCVTEFPGYAFACHEMMISELSRHGTRPAQEWVNDKITSGVIQKYTDEDIINVLFEEIGHHCYSRYLSFLKQSCDAFQADYFEDKYQKLIVLTNSEFTKQDFLITLSECDTSIGPQQSLGEKKAYVLLLTMKFLKGDQVFLFCSDDRNARKGLSSASRIPCVSIIAVFYKLMKMGVSKEKAYSYYSSFCNFCNQSGQTQLRVWEHKGTDRLVKMDLTVIFDGLYSDLFELLLNGDLRIKNE